MTRKPLLLVLLILFAGGLAGYLLATGRALAQEGAGRAAEAPEATIGTGFNYDGWLTENGVPVNGSCDFQFLLFDGAVGGSQIGFTESVSGLTVDNGRFSVTLNGMNAYGSEAFRGDVRWLEVQVRCPAGGGGYTILSPRQLLSATPYALGLRPGAVISGSLPSGNALTLANSGVNGGGLEVAQAGGDGVFVCATGSETGCPSSGFNNGVEIGRAEAHGMLVNEAGGAGVRVNTTGGAGLYVVNPGGSGLRVEDAGTDALNVIDTSGSGLRVAAADEHGVSVGTVLSDGVRIDVAGGAGLYVDDAAGDGFFVCHTGSETGCTPSTLHNGFEVGSAEHAGVFVGQAGLAGVRVDSAGSDGVSVSSAGDDGVWVGSADGDGLRVISAGVYGVGVDSADLDGVWVGYAGRYGVHVDGAGEDGVLIYDAGNASNHISTPSKNGVEVQGAAGNGVWVGSAGLDGILIYDAGNASSHIASPFANGVEVQGAAGDGVAVGAAGGDGVQVYQAGDDGFQICITGSSTTCTSQTTHNGIESLNSEDYAGFFGKDIFVNGSCSGCLLATFGVNAGSGTLQPGDVVTLRQLADGGSLGLSMLMEVDVGQAGQPIVGVVDGWAELVTPDEPNSDEQPGLVPRGGPVAPGEYVNIIIYGPVQVRADATEGAIEMGRKLTVDGDGQARPLQQQEFVLVDGGTAAMTEQAPTVGVALSTPDEDGMVWVLVNPQ